MAGLTTVFISAIGGCTGLIIGGLAASGSSAGTTAVFMAVIDGAVGSLSNFLGTLLYTIPLGLNGLAIAIAYKAGVFNIGAEGQMHAGALAAAAMALGPAATAGVGALPLAIGAGIIGGSLWSLIPGFLRAYGGYNETVATMLLNHVAILGVGLFLQGPLKDPRAFFPQTRVLPEICRLPRLLEISPLHQGFWILPIAALTVWLLLFRTSFGLRLRATGCNPLAARHVGIDVSSVIMIVMGISGLLAGLAGALEVTGTAYRLSEGFSPGYGYDAIAVALVANLHPLGILLSAFFFGALRAASSELRVDLGMPISIIQIIQATTILFILGTRGFMRRDT